MAKKEKNFWQKMFADGTTDTISSKRVTMFMAMLMLIGLSIASACGYSCAESYVYIFGSLVASQSGLSTIEKVKKNTNSANVEIAEARYNDRNGNGIDDDEEGIDNNESLDA